MTCRLREEARSIGGLSESKEVSTNSSCRFDSPRSVHPLRAVERTGRSPFSPPLSLVIIPREHLERCGIHQFRQWRPSIIGWITRSVYHLRSPPPHCFRRFSGKRAMVSTCQNTLKWSERDTSFNVQTTPELWHSQFLAHPSATRKGVTTTDRHRTNS
jgi:hypothetical protein